MLTEGVDGFVSIPGSLSPPSTLKRLPAILAGPYGSSRSEIGGRDCRAFGFVDHSGKPKVIGCLAVILFAPAARALAVRDAWLGWGDASRERHHVRVFGLPGLLIRPPDYVRCLASRAQGMAGRYAGALWRRPRSPR